MKETQQGQSTTKKRLVLFRGQWDTLNLFSEQLKQGFLELGYEIFEYDALKGSESFSRFLEYVLESPVTALIGFNSPFFRTESPTGGYMLEELGIPSINILVDHPYWYHNEILMRTPANGIVLCVDRNHMDYVSRYYPNISCTGFLAHGGTSFYLTHKPISERKIDVLYAGALKSHVKLSDFFVLDFPAKQIAEHLLIHPEDTVEAAVEQELLRADVVFSDEKLREFISSVAKMDHFVSSYYRERIVGSVAKAGVSLELYGPGWENCDWVDLPNVHYSVRVSPEEILLKMEDSKIVLNSMPWFRDGSHERIFNAMLCGAIAVSETSKYLEETLPSDTWVSFDLSAESLSALPQRILDLLSDESRMQKIASSGHDLAASSHTWKARALELHQDLLSNL